MEVILEKYSNFIDFNSEKTIQIDLDEIYTAYRCTEGSGEVSRIIELQSKEIFYVQDELYTIFNRLEAAGNIEAASRISYMYGRPMALTP